MNPFEKNAFDYSSFGKAFAAPFESANPGIAVMQQWNASLLRTGFEVAGFWSRRARAGLDAQRRYAGCRTLQDVASVNAELTTAALRDVSETAQRSWSILLAPVKLPAAKPASPSAAGPAPTRPAPTAEVAEAPASYEWWRTDMKAIMPRRNGHANGADNVRSGL